MSTDDLVAFLTARLDEDEQWANETAGPLYSEPHDEGAPGHHGRVLADVAAKRNLIAVMATVLIPMPTPVGYPDAARKMKLEVERAEEQLATLTLRVLASPYRSHPDWREEWRA